MATRQSQLARSRSVLLVGILLYLVSWLVPVFEGQELFGALGGFAQSLGADPQSAAGALSGPDWLPGWSACRVAWDVLTEQQSAGDDWKRIVVGSTCLTNVAMLGVLVALACGVRSQMLGALLLACAALNASWIYLGGADVIEALRAGYYLWAGSFVVTGIALVIPAGDPP